MNFCDGTCNCWLDFGVWWTVFFFHFASALVTATMSPVPGRCLGLLVSIRQCTDISGRRVPAHRWYQHAPTSLDWRGNVCGSMVAQHLWGSVFRNGWTMPVELVRSKLRQCDTLGKFKRLLNTHLFSDHGALWHFLVKSAVTCLLTVVPASWVPYRQHRGVIAMQSTFKCCWQMQVDYVCGSWWFALINNRR